MGYKTFNYDSLIDHFRGDEEILIELIVLFIGEYPLLMKKLHESIMENDSQRVRLKSHTLKGLLSSFYADKAKSFAYQIELSEQASKEYALETFNQLKKSIDELVLELEILKSELQEKF